MVIFLAIELLDELVFGVREAAWPLLRDELGFDYTTVGVLLSVPNVVSAMIEPVLGILGDTGKRRLIIAGGGCAFAAGLALTAVSGGFVSLLIAFVILYPASGAFVGLSQASLMDVEPARHDQNMARWVLAGSLGVALGPLLLAFTSRMGWGWRPLFVCLAVATLPLVLLSRHTDHPTVVTASDFRRSVGAAWSALRDREVVRWLVLLELTDLLGDLLTGFLAIYFVDVVDVSPGGAALAILIWSVAGLAGDALLVPLLARFSGVSYLRLSAAVVGLVFPGFLLTPGLLAKLVLLAVLGVIRAGWYAIPQARLYSALRGNSGVALALSNIIGLPAYAFPILLGLLAQHFGLGSALWCCVLAPVGLLVGLPCHAGREEQAQEV